MNILMLNWRGPNHPLSGGAEQVTFKYCQYWSDQGHTVYWYTSRVAGQPNRQDLSGVHIIRGGADILGVQIAAFLWYVFAKKPRFDVVIDQFHGIPFFAIFYVRCKLVGFIHEVAQPVWHLNPWPKPLNIIPAVIGKYIEPIILKLYSQVPFITVSPSTQKDIKNFGIINTAVIPNGINFPEKLSSLPREKVFTVIYLSSISRDKGIQDALQSFQLVRSEIPNAQFWVVGKGDNTFTARLQSLYPYVKFFGFVSESRKYELLSRAHVLVFPSIHEGWGLVILEAAAVGTPTVAYNVSGVRDAVKDAATGLLVKPADVEALASQVIRLSKDHKLYRQLSGECKKWSRQFSWESSLKSSLKFLEKIVYTKS